MPQETRGEAEDILSSRQKQKLVEISHQSWLGNVNTQQIATTANCDVHKSSECQIVSVSVAEPGVKSSLPENLHGSSVCASKDKSTCSINSTASSECATKPVLPQLPERRKLKPFPEGVVTQQEGRPIVSTYVMPTLKFSMVKEKNFWGPKLQCLSRMVT